MQPYKAGNVFQGGIIFNIDETGKHGLIVSEKDLSATADWDEAVRYCLDYRAGGYHDWRLPSIEELDILFQHKASAGSFTRFSYWSSTEYAEHFAWFIHFHTGERDNDFKDNTCNVRAIRNF